MEKWLASRLCDLSNVELENSNAKCSLYILLLLLLFVQMLSRSLCDDHLIVSGACGMVYVAKAILWIVRQSFKVMKQTL